MKGDAVITIIRPLADSRRVLPDHTETIKLPECLLCVRRLFRILRKSELATNRHRRLWRFDAHPPIGDVDHMRAPIGHQSTRIVPVPAKIEVESVAVEWAFRRRAEPHVIVERRRNRLVRNDRNIPHPVLICPGLDQADLAELAAPHVLNRLCKL